MNEGAHGGRQKLHLIMTLKTTLILVLAALLTQVSQGIAQTQVLDVMGNPIGPDRKLITSVPIAEPKLSWDNQSVLSKLEATTLMKLAIDGNAT